MEPRSEIRIPVRVESKVPLIASLKSKSAEAVKKALPEKTLRWLTEATSHVQRGNGRKALETMAIPPTDQPIPKESKTVSKEKPGKSSTTKTKDNGKAPTPITESPSREKTNIKDEEIAMGMRKNEEKRKTIEEPTKPPKQREAASDGLLQGKNIEALVQQKDNPQAQVEAIVLISNGYRNFNIRNNECMSWLAAADIDAVSQVLRLNAESVKNSRQTLLDVHKRYYEISRHREQISEDLRFQWDDRKPELQKQFDELIDQEQSVETEMGRQYREFMLPIRTAVLSSESLPEAYKLNVIEGIKDYGEVLLEEDGLLKRTYAVGNKTIKRQIADTVMFNIGHDLNSFNVIPFDDLKSLGVDVDKLFIATLGNPRTDGAFVKTRVAPNFFPGENPIKVRQCYETLKKVTGLENRPSETSFYSDGHNHDTNGMNIDVFKNFIDNSESLIPVVEVLSGYGFKYRPSNFLDGKFSEQYVEVLKEIGQNLVQLRTELDAIKAILPDYKYDYKVDTRYRGKESKRETFIDDNPFTMALKQKIYLNGIDTPERMNEAVHLFESLQQIVPDRWKSGFISTYMEMMTILAGYSDKSSEVTQKAISEANKYIFDPILTLDQIESFATEFFGSSLDAKNENTEIAVKFCEKYAGNIRTWVEDKKHVDADATWYTLSLKTSDLYRYPIIAGKEDAALAKAKTDLSWASEAVSRITDPVLRDKAIANLIYALTDEEIGNMQNAQRFVDIMQDEVLKKDAQAEIELEKERIEKGETTTWKKMEKVRRASAASKKFLTDLFGYGNADDLSKAGNEYWKYFHTSSDFQATFNPENHAKLEQEIARIQGNYHVTVNMTWANVLSSLETGRVISAWENTEVMETRNKYGEYHYETRRNEIERLLGNRAKGGIRDPHPIYGAAASPNNRDEYYGGTGGGYGECFLVLKSDQIRNRTSFIYDDSFDGYNRWTLDWDDGITAKAIHNLNSSQSRHGYVEAEILGGVSVGDIDSINIPSDSISGENKHGFSAGQDVLSTIDQLRQRYPGVKINIVQVPSA